MSRDLYKDITLNQIIVEDLGRELQALMKLNFRYFLNVETLDDQK